MVQDPWQRVRHCVCGLGCYFDHPRCVRCSRTYSASKTRHRECLQRTADVLGKKCIAPNIRIPAFKGLLSLKKLGALEGPEQRSIAIA